MFSVYFSVYFGRGQEGECRRVGASPALIHKGNWVLGELRALPRCLAARFCRRGCGAPLRAAGSLPRPEALGCTAKGTNLLG